MSRSGFERAPGDEMFDAIARGDYAAVEALWASDIAVWHAGDAADNDRSQALRIIRWFIDVTTSRRYDILGRRTFAGGFVQQHVLHATSAGGQAIALRVCIVVEVDDGGLITRIDEYFDPAGMAPLMRAR